MTRDLIYKMFTISVAATLTVGAGCDKTQVVLKAGPGGGSSGQMGGAAGGTSGAVGGSTGAGGGASLAAMQARGKYIVDVVAACGDCHTPRDAMGKPIMAMYLAGNPSFISAGPGQSLGSRNLTSDATGLKNRTDADIKKMFQEGLRPTATGMEPLNPVMPYYVFRNMTDDDADAVVAYLRTVPAVANDIPHRGTMFDVPAAAPPLSDAVIPLPVATYPDQASALRGRYLATKAGVCIECHTKHTDSKAVPAPLTVLDETKLFAGGEDFSAGFMGRLTPVSKNLTSDMVTGLGTWTTADIVTALMMGLAKDGTGICPPMPVGPMGAFGHLLPGDALDIANYIKSLPPITNMIVDMCQVGPPVGAGGAGGGTAGASGTAGKGGTAGTTGSAGRTGTAGTTGAAGSSGVGGAGGA